MPSAFKIYWLIQHGVNALAEGQSPCIKILDSLILIILRVDLKGGFFVATKVIKGEVIRVRVTLEQKEKLKEIAKEKNKTMSEILSVATENEIKKFEERAKNYKKICARSVATEEKIQSIKERLEERKLKNRKSFWRK